MLTVLIVIHLMIAISLIALILFQKSEGNAAGGGFSVSAMSAMQPRARPNPLSRATTILGIGFFVTSIGLALVAKNLGPAPSLLNSNPATASGRAPRVDEVTTPAATAPAEKAPEAAPAVPAVPTVPKN